MSTSIASCSTVILTHDFDSSNLLLRIQNHSGKINCVTWNHNNRILASSGDDSSIFLSLAETGERVGVFEVKEEQPSPVNSIAFTSKSDLLASGYANGTVKVWDLHKKEVSMNVRQHSDSVSCVSWNATDTQVASGSLSGEIALHSMLTQVSVANLKQKGSGGIKLLQFSQLKKQLLGAATDNGSVYIWDANSRTVTASFPNFHNSPVTGLAFSSVNHMLMCTAGLDHKVHFYDIQERRVVKTMELEAPITSLAFNGEGHTIAIGTLYGGVQIYDLRSTNAAKSNLRGHEGSSVNWIEFSKVRGRERPAPSRSASYNTQAKEPSSATSLKSGDESPYPGGRFRTIEEIKQEAKLRVEMKRREQREGTNPEINNRSVSPFPGVKPPVVPQPQENLTTVSEPALKIPETFKPTEKPLTPKPPPTPEVPKPVVEIPPKVPQPDKIPAKLQEIPQEEAKKPPESVVSEARKKVESILNDKPLDTSRLETIENKLESQEKAITGLRDDIHNLHIELIRQFMIQQNDMRSLLEEYSSANSKLLQELSDLKEENLRLKHNSY
ncbi:unnamed protein product [Blepharisma stoltei]|uniref:Anaphase-promoting complex subunit 4-like WD40 domain-containing protein n=1 Tax=Blepharisma stoltei TaxID=1481888 RepID=A0AAU9IP25_9CILI|nr:unnamed protein product [Blepharisma stoltei]